MDFTGCLLVLLTTKLLMTSQHNFITVEEDAKAEALKQGEIEIVIKPSEPLHVQEGDDVKVKCIVNGFDPENDSRGWRTPQGTKLHNVKVESSGKMVILSIKHATFENNGTYECQANQPADSAYTWSKKIDILIHMEPKITSRKSIVAAHMGRSVTLHCPYRGYPEPDITWRFNNKLILPKERSYSMRHSNLVIPVVKSDNLGRYECRLGRSANETHDFYVQKLIMICTRAEKSSWIVPSEISILGCLVLIYTIV